MEDVMRIIAVAAVMIFGFFIMKRLDVFWKENRKSNCKGTKRRMQSA